MLSGYVGKEEPIGILTEMSTTLHCPAIPTPRTGGGLIRLLTLSSIVRNSPAKSTVTFGPNHSAIICEHGASSTVLLKNERNTLLFRKPRNTLIAGNDVGPLMQGPDTKANFEYRVLAGSSGSSSYRFSFLLRPLDAVNARARKDGSLVRYI